MASSSTIEYFIEQKLGRPLRDGEVVCDRCEGEGILFEYVGAGFCKKCDGSGYVDWIENITWKGRNNET